MEVEEEIGRDGGRDITGESRGFLGITRDCPGFCLKLSCPTIIAPRLGSLNTMMNRRTYSEGMLNDVCTGILCDLVHGLEEITDELILAVVVVCGFFVVR